MAAWRDGRFQQIFDDADAELRDSLGGPETLAHLTKQFEPIAGKLVELGAPLSYATKDYGYAVSGPAKFDKGTLTFELAFHLIDGKPKLDYFQLKLPKELQATPDNAAGEKLARRALDAALADKFADVMAIGTNELVHAVKSKPDSVKDLEAIAHKLGAVRSVKLRDQKDCETGVRGRRCITYDVTGAKGKSTAEVMVVFAISDWEVNGVTLTPS
jgi:hypothetical protein